MENDFNHRIMPPKIQTQQQTVNIGDPDLEVVLTLATLICLKTWENYDENANIDNDVTNMVFFRLTGV